jgi:sulfur carrier protein
MVNAPRLLRCTAGARLWGHLGDGTVPPFPPRPPMMQVRLEPQGKQLTISGRRRVGELVQSLGILAGTVMVIRGDELLTDDEFVDDTDTIELRAVISGGAS